TFQIWERMRRSQVVRTARTLPSPSRTGNTMLTKMPSPRTAQTRKLVASLHLTVLVRERKTPRAEKVSRKAGTARKIGESDRGIRAKEILSRLWMLQKPLN